MGGVKLGRKMSRYMVIGALALPSLMSFSASAPQSAGSSSGESALHVGFGETGLNALSFRSQSLLRSATSGLLRPANHSPLLKTTAGATAIGSSSANSESFDAVHRTVTQSYAWGTVRAQYAQKKDRLTVSLTVTNASQDEKIDHLDLQLCELTFPDAPQGSVLDAGQFGLDKIHPLAEYPLFASSEAMPPIIDVRYGEGTLLFCGESSVSPITVGVSAAMDPPTNTSYPMIVSFGPIEPGRSTTAEVSLRFGAPGDDAKSLAGDTLDRYAKRYPYQLAWKDRRAIGGLVLASVGKHAATNPRGWFNNVSDVDVITPAGLVAFRTRLLAYADESIRELKAANAQGMITWDVEGQEVDYVCYYGDPRLAEKVAPETSYVGNGKLACLDEYFKKFRDAGFRVGVCIRPQQMRFVNGQPKQEDVADPEQVLGAKIAYARRRWGCTLFYLDSTVDEKGRALPADIFKHLADTNRDVLLIPENETLRDYAYSAPLNSFQHHNVTSTPPGARQVYPQAFSVLFAMEGDFAHHFDDLVASVRRGDILLFRGWWADPNNPVIRRIYDAAKPDHSRSSAPLKPQG